MSQKLSVLDFPLHGSRLIEASAGTGKTWTIAALYVRLVLGHGGENGFRQPLHPSQILVMTFTRAATRELSDRIRERLLEAAQCFRGESLETDDHLLAGLLADYPDRPSRARAAHVLTLAAEAMDEAAVFTIDSWCQRMLREHAFDSGCLFDEELVASEENILWDAVRDYWRHHVYRLNPEEFHLYATHWSDPAALEKKVKPLLVHAGLLGDPVEQALGDLVRQGMQSLAQIKEGWLERSERMHEWIKQQRTLVPGCFHQGWMEPGKVAGWFEALSAWAVNPVAVSPGDEFKNGWTWLTPEGLEKASTKGFSVQAPEDFSQMAVLKEQLAEIQQLLEFPLLQHAVRWIGRRIRELKQQARRFGFADMLVRLKDALQGPNQEALRACITRQFPVAMVDEFQDTSTDQYRILDSLYRIAQSDPEYGLFLIGDPKQAIYRFRGADIESYLAAREATLGRHYMLDTNHRSSPALVTAVNQLFLHAETKTAEGAFRYRGPCSDPLPFHPAASRPREEELRRGSEKLTAVTLWCRQPGEAQNESEQQKQNDPQATKRNYNEYFAALCAEQIARLLNDETVGFHGVSGEFSRLQEADIAVLVRDRNEAGYVRRALLTRGIPSVYLSDKESVFKTPESADVLRWMKAVNNPYDTSLARAAFATTTACMSLDELQMIASDELEWEKRIESLKQLRQTWNSQGVLAMLRRFIHQHELPCRLLASQGGERSMTNLLHLAELLQGASQQIEGEQALIRWLAERIEDDSEMGDERIVRLESDAALVKVITMHKSKGLEYPLVFVPFAVFARNDADQGFYLRRDQAGRERLEFFSSDQAPDSVHEERIREDIRLLYVAFTRAKHAMWIGVGVPGVRAKISSSAFCHLLAADEEVTGANLLQKLRGAYGSCSDISIDTPASDPGCTILMRRAEGRELAGPRKYAAAFERNWGVASYTSITRSLGNVPAPATPQEQKLLEEDDSVQVVQPQNDPWHRFPRGTRAGQFLHEQLEWMAQEGFRMAGSELDSRLQARCDRVGWSEHAADLAEWLKKVVTIPLPPLGRPLQDLEQLLPEMEFWLPAYGLDIGELDRQCRQLLSDEITCPPLSGRHLSGMLRGFMDLVFHDGERYWVLDYKSNMLGAGDGDYHAQALEKAIGASRYDVQGTIYLLALHRLLKNRLGAAYHPDRHLGGAIFFFLRGVENPDTHGCHSTRPDVGLLEQLDRLLQTDAEAAA